jgi:hypothetical protein
MSRNVPKRVPHLTLAIGLAVAFFSFAVSITGTASAQDQDHEDPPGRVARLGYMQGSVSFQPAGEDDWVEAVSNRPMTTGDKLWADRDSRAEVQLGASTIDLNSSTGFSFLNLDDRTVQMEITAGAINIRVWSLDRDTDYEIDTPNQAFTVTQPGRYRIEASENGDYSVVTIWEGAGESTGNGQTYTLHAGQRTTFNGTNQLNAEVSQIGNPDDFDRWSDDRYRRYQDSPSARYCSRDVVGFEDLDENGDWGSSPDYGEVWYPRVDPGWAPYHEGHWAWVDPWGWTWVDDDRWGYAPFHYGRWAYVGNRWGWVPGPRDVYPVYAPALVAFVGGGGIAFGSNVAWFPLGPREVYVPSYRVSEAYVNRVNVTNTVVNRTEITNVYRTTIINNNTNITNVRYVNRDVHGAVTAVPRQAFASAQPVSRAAVAVNAQEIARAPVSRRAAIPPAQQAVYGAHANTAGHVAAPPRAIAQRPVIAKSAPPPPPPSFSSRQSLLAQHPGVPVARPELQKLRSASTETASLVKRAPPGRPATPTPAPSRGETRPGNPPAANERPGTNLAAPGHPQPGNQPSPNARPEPGRPESNRPAQPPARNDRPPSAQPNNRPEPNRPAQPPARNERPQPTPNNRPEPNRAPTAQPNNQLNRPEPNRPSEPPARNDRPPSAQPNSRPEPSRPEPNRPAEPPARNERPVEHPQARPEPSRPEPSRPAEQPRSQPAPREAPPEHAAPPRREEPRPQPKQEDRGRKDEPPKGS